MSSSAIAYRSPLVALLSCLLLVAGSAPFQGPPAPGSSQSDLLALSRNVNFVQVPVLVRDRSGGLVEDLGARDFTVYEDGVPQKLSFFSSEPSYLSVAVVVESALSAPTLEKVKKTLPKLVKDFRQSDELALYRYGNTVLQVSGFASADSTPASALKKVVSSGQSESLPARPPQLGDTSRPFDPNAPQIHAAPANSHALNDALLRAAEDLSKRSAMRRRIILVIGSGSEYGSSARADEVRKVLLAHDISIYAVALDIPSIPVYDTVNRNRLTGFGLGDVLAKYVSDTGGEAFAESSIESIEEAYLGIVGGARNRYLLGYNTAATRSATYRTIDVHVNQPDLAVTAKAGYYPLLR